MTIRKKTLLTIAITFFILFLILFLAAHFILLEGFGNLEKKDASDKVQQTVNVLLNDIATLDDSLSDWANWDDTYAFIEDGNQTYIDSNLIDSTFSQLNLSFIVYLNQSGQIVFSKGFDLQKKESVPVPQSLIKIFSSRHLFSNHYPSTPRRTLGILVLPEGPVLISFRPILTSKREGPARGTMVMGRYLDSLEIARLTKITRLPILVARFNDTRLPPDFQTARSLLLQRSSTTIAQPQNDYLFGGYALLNDIYGKPALLLKIETSRKISQQGKLSIFYFLISLLITSVVFAIIFMVLLEKQVISPLMLLGENVNKIAKDGAMTKRVPVIGEDEFSTLTDQINQMLNALEVADKEKHELEIRLQRAQKMEAIGTLAGGVAHDLNNVLSGLVGYPQFLLMKIPKDSPLREAVEIIQQSGEKAAEIVQDLLTLARRGVSISAVVNLNTIISDYLKSPEYKKLKKFHPSVHFETCFGNDLLNVLGSSIHLSKTVMNLVSNAAEAMPDGGEVCITTKNIYLDKPISEYDHTPPGDYVRLMVADTGIGISEEDRKKIFEPFFTKKKMGRSGTGLGMAVVWATVKDHHGYIDILSSEGKGTTIAIYLPVTRQKPVGDKVLVRIEEYSGKGESILIVDDVVEQRKIASTLLENLGYTVKAVPSGEEAVDYLKNNAMDLIVLDMIMDPGIDGLETYKRILTFRPGQKAIIVSGFSENDKVKEVQKLGAGSYLKKPYRLEQFGLAVRRELDR